MALIDWQDDFSVNIKSVDQQHIMLVALINDLHSAMKQGKGKEAISTVVHELLEYTKVHFSYEEGLMKNNSYPGYIEHKAKHDALVKQVVEIDDNLKAGKVVISQDVLNFLKKWLVEHILDTDKKYSSFLNGKGVK